METINERPTEEADVVRGELSSDPLDERMLYSDLANARRFATEHRDALRYVAKDRRWYVWTGTHWQEDNLSEVQRRAKATVQAMYDRACGMAAQTRDEIERRDQLVRYAIGAQRGGRIQRHD